MNRFPFLALILVLQAGCAGETSRIDIEHEQNDAIVYLPRIVALDDERLYPDGLRLDKRPPASLASAVDALVEALPRVEAGVADPAVCSFKDLDGMDRGFAACNEVACQSLPASSRERGCGYLVRLTQWVERNWLGGLCQFEVSSRTGDLVEWFQRRGVQDCHLMSAAVSISLAQALVGNRQEPESVLHALKNEPQ